MEEGAALLGLGRVKGGDTVAVFMEEAMNFSPHPEESLWEQWVELVW